MGFERVDMDPPELFAHPGYGRVATVSGDMKLVFIAVAGLNAAIFAVTPYGRALPDNGGATPRAAKVIAAVSLCLWTATIVSGRLITFYRPGICNPGETHVVSLCIP